MNRDRELKQFKFIIKSALVVYPFWLIYGLWAGSYTAPISVGIMCIWANWYINYTKSKAQDSSDTSDSEIDWYSYSIEKYINFPILVISLLGAIALGAGILLVIDFAFGIL